MSIQETLNVLRRVHAELLRKSVQPKDTFTERVTRFILQLRQTGALTGNEDEREELSALIDVWGSWLETHGDSPPKMTLYAYAGEEDEKEPAKPSQLPPIPKPKPQRANSPDITPKSSVPPPKKKSVTPEQAPPPEPVSRSPRTGKQNQDQDESLIMLAQRITRRLNLTTAAILIIIGSVAISTFAIMGLFSLINRTPQNTPVPTPVDSDADGLYDNVDTCPNSAGPSQNQGCPTDDQDSDGVKDADDVCPERRGSSKNAGCPADRDGDAITNALDQCPDQAGPGENNGCPDAPADDDGDGTINAQDRCPDVLGPPQLWGCPAAEGDADGDQILDEADACPLEMGIGDGCPVAENDADGDGVRDNEDQCPVEAGEAQYEGCLPTPTSTFTATTTPSQTPTPTLTPSLTPTSTPEAPDFATNTPEAVG
jgi:hypothetical protein